MIRVADYIADFVYKQGVKNVFMLTGGGSIYLDDGIACHKDLNYICVRNEATAPMMAEAYARLTQNLGVAYVTTGPGGTNAVSGLSEAWVDSAPILVISGQVQRNHTTYNSNIPNLRTFGTQEINIIEIVKPITKYAQMVNDPESIRYHLEKAVHFAKSARPGPVWLDVPLDVQAAMIDEKQLKGYENDSDVSGDENENLHIDEVLELLSSATKPLLIAGQGIRIAGAIDEFKKLIELLDIPVVSSRLGQDILPFSNKNNFGHGGLKGLRFTNAIMAESDLLLSIGSRLSVQFVGLNFDAFSKDSKVIMVDIDDAELNKPGIKIDLPIKADAKIFIQKLLNRIEHYQFQDYTKWLEICRDYKVRYPLITAEYERNPIDLYYFVHRLDELSRQNHIFVSDAGSSYYVAGQALKFQYGQREITSGAFASMGLSIPLAIGCSVADKNAQVLAITGDGSLELNIQELKTMSCYGLNIKLFVINNGGYVSIRNTQDSVCQGRYIGSDQSSGIETLDLQKVSATFELPYFKIEKHDQIDDKLMEVMSSNGPAFVEVVCDNNQKIIEPLQLSSMVKV